MTEQPVFCDNCQRRLEETAQFCSNCGHLVPGSGQDPTLQQTPTDQAEALSILKTAWQLFSVEGSLSKKTFTLGVLTRIGRHPDSDIFIDDKQISRQHATIDRTSQGYFIRDLGSTNGTFVNKKQINQSTQLRAGDAISLGSHRFIVMKDSFKCTNCGEKVGAEERFCKFCGEALSGIKTPERGVQTVAEELSTTPPPNLGETQPPPPAPHESIPPPPRAVSAVPPPPPVELSVPQPPAQVLPPTPVGPQQIVPPPPPQAGASGSAAQPKKKRNWLRTCLILFVIAACSLVALGAGGYFLATSGILSRRTVLNTLGMGYGEITITNIANDSLEANLVRLDTESGEPELFNDLEIGSFEISGFGGITPGRYELELISVTGIPTGGLCLMQIGSGEAYSFVAVPEGIAVAQEGEEAATADDLIFESSPVCRQ